jgi:hypothetical protein
MQSRGNPPVANCIFAKLLHARRSLLRRFAYMCRSLTLDLINPVADDATGESLESA